MEGVGDGGDIVRMDKGTAERGWAMAELARRGASAQVRERMSYVASVLEEFAELDEQSSST